MRDWLLGQAVAQSCSVSAGPAGGCHRQQGWYHCTSFAICGFNFLFQVFCHVRAFYFLVLHQRHRGGISHPTPWITWRCNLVHAHTHHTPHTYSCCISDLIGLPMLSAPGSCAFARGPRRGSRGCYCVVVYAVPAVGQTIREERVFLHQVHCAVPQYANQIPPYLCYVIASCSAIRDVFFLAETSVST